MHYLFMKIILSALLLTFIIQIAKAQNNNITGSVQDENGRLLHFVFIEDIKYKNMTFSDSLGTFTIPIHADSKFRFEAEGYRDTSVTGDRINPVPQIILKSVVKVPVETTNLSIETTRTANGLVAIAAKRPNQVGSRYLFDTFSHGYFTDTTGKLINNESFLFDYDKVSGVLLLTIDKRYISAIVRDQIKSFTLYNNADQRVYFEKVPAIDNARYMQVLATGAKYKICKLIKTKFVAADFQATASGGSGHDYDEFVDDAQYYVLDVESNQPQKLDLRKKSIKDDFSKDAVKVNKYLSENSARIDDAYLSSLGEFMNQ
jgi:hypothetical protein